MCSLWIYRPLSVTFGKRSVDNQTLRFCSSLHILLKPLGPYYIMHIRSTRCIGYFLNLRNFGHAEILDFLAQNQIYENISFIFSSFYEAFGHLLYKECMRSIRFSSWFVEFRNIFHDFLIFVCFLFNLYLTRQAGLVPDQVGTTFEMTPGIASGCPVRCSPTRNYVRGRFDACGPLFWPLFDHVYYSH